MIDLIDSEVDEGVFLDDALDALLFIVASEDQSEKMPIQVWL